MSDDDGDGDEDEPWLNLDPETTGDPGDGADSGEDPFERLDPSDQEGDPLEQFETGPDATGDREPGDRDPSGSLGDQDPRADVGEREGDPFTSAESAFERMDVDDLDPDAVWEDLAAAEARGSVSEQGDSVYAEVSKHRFCEQCEYFSEPPDATCTHDGTQIIEFLDMETVRVLDCPVVEERRELEEQT